MKKKFLSIFLIISNLCVYAQLTIRVTSVPINTPADAKIYVLGNFNNWNPNDTSKILKRQNDGSLAVTFTPSVSALVFKFTQYNWSPPEATTQGGFRPNRTLTYNGGAQTVNLTIGGWEGQSNVGSTAAPNVRILSNTFATPQLGKTRRIWLHLPPQYSDTSKRFPVFYMHDGQNLFDKVTTAFGTEWQIDETLNTLAAQGDKGCIVVGIDNGGGSRLDEYSAYKNARYGGGQGAAYAKFIAQTLKPYIDANYRTKSDRLNTAIGGSSMGGLISMYIAAEYQNTFSKALIFSPSFWFADSCYTHVRKRGKQFPMRYYVMAGTNEDADLVAQMTRMTDILRGAGYTGEEVKTVLKTDGQHAEWFWAREFVDGYKWLFREGATKVDGVKINTKITLFPNPTD
ncbi:MAG: alpha/beta hydrolase-fold protein [Saprospiraceae bacterium]|nr:alpha/beta hydrolase-fold protein [Saprospiraceae bacterium]